MKSSIANENRISKKNMVFAVVLTMVSGLLRICKVNDINVSLDEIGTLAGAAFVSGNDWSSVLAETRYYGVGFYWLYGVFFRLIQDPYILSVLIYVANCLCISLMAVLSYQLLVKYLHMKDTWYTVMIAAFPGMVYAYANWSYISNDVPVYCAYWLLVYWATLAYSKSGDIKGKRFYSILTAIAMGYLLTVHEKSIAVWIAVILSIILFKFIFGEFFVSPISFAVTSVLSYGLARVIKEGAITLFWPKAESLANTSAFSSTTDFLFNKLLGWKIMLDIIISNFILLNEKTFGLISVAAVFCIYWLVRGVICLAQGKRLNWTKANKIRFFLILVSFIATGAIVVGLAVQWGPGVYKGYCKGTIGKSTRAFGYWRYYGAFTGPAVIAVCSMLKYLMKYAKKMMCVATALTIVLVAYYYFFIHTYLFDRWSTTSLAVFNVFPSDKAAWNIYLSLVVLCTIAVGLCIIKNKAKIQTYFGFSFFALLLMSVNFNNLAIPSVESGVSGAGYEFIKELEKTGVSIGNLYAEVNASAYQFMLNDYTILNGFPTSDVEECIVLSSYEWTNEHPYSPGCYGFYGTQLDGNEYVYIKGEKYRNLLEDMGYSLQKDTILNGTDSYIMQEESGATYAIYDDSTVLEQGTYYVTYSVKVLSELSLESYGYVDVAKSDAAYLNRKEINGWLLDENGEGTITLLISSDKKMEDVVFRYFAYAGVEMEIFPVEIEKVSERYDVGADDAKTLTSITSLLSYYNTVHGYHEVYFINDETKGDDGNTTEFLQLLLSENKVICVNREQFEELDFLKNCYIITFSESDYNNKLDWDNGYWALCTIEEYSLYLREFEHAK